MRRVFLLSLLLVMLTVVIAWCVVHFSAPRAEPAAGVDAETMITVRQGGTIRSLPLSDWLPGVVAAEMPAKFAPEALRAQAVAARTYILDRMQNRSKAHPDADVCDDPKCCTAWLSDEVLTQNWGADADAFRAKVAAAVSDTDGEILRYDGAPIRAVFHSSSAGQTESSAALCGERAYLVSVPSPETAADVPNYVVEADISPESLQSAVLEAHPDCVFPEDPAQWLTAAEHDESGRVKSIGVGSVVLTGAEVRALLGLRSTAFTVQFADGVFRFTTTGSGHGVGMSQYGANVMAKQGSTYAEILAHYYPGTELCKLES